MEYTISLEECVDMGWKFITDEEYNSTDEDLASIQLTPKKVYDDLIDYYLYYDIAFETIQRFGFEFRRVWDREYPKLKQRCAMFSKINKDEALSDYVHNYQTGSDGQTDFSDTPNEAMYQDENGDVPKYLTTRTKSKANSKTNDALYRNPYDAFDKFSTTVRNVEYDFIEKFNGLFSTYIPIKDTPYPQAGIPPYLAWRTYKK